MNKRIKRFVVLALVLGLLMIESLMPKTYAFSKSEVVFNNQEVGISSPEYISPDTTYVQMRVYDSTKEYSAQAINYTDEEFQTVGYYLKKALSIQNLGDAYKQKAKGKQTIYKELMDNSDTVIEREKYELLFNDAKEEETAVVEEYTPKIMAAVNDYIENCIRYPEDDLWVSLDESYSVYKDDLNTSTMYMLWLRGISQSGVVRMTPVLYSLPGSFQVVNFNQNIKSNVQSIKINGKISLGSYISYHRGRTIVPTTWKSLDPDILSVDSDGNVKGLKNGFGIITAENEDSLDAVVIYVTDEVAEEEEEVTPQVDPTPSDNSGLVIRKEGNDLIISQPTSKTPGTAATDKAQDDTTAKGKYPATGKIKLITIGSGLLIVAGYIVIQTLRLKDVK